MYLIISKTSQRLLRHQKIVGLPYLFLAVTEVNALPIYTQKMDKKMVVHIRQAVRAVTFLARANL